MNPLPAMPLPRLSSANSQPDILLKRAIAGVLQHARECILPPFAGTLGLDRPDLHRMLEECFSGLCMPQPMPADGYASVQESTPPAFFELVGLLNRHRVEGVDASHIDWLARAIAAASFGSHHLWQDLGLSGRDDVSLLLGSYFPSLHGRNTGNLKWKHFLFQELGRQQGEPDMRPPNCGNCEQFRICFAPETGGENNVSGR